MSRRFDTPLDARHFLGIPRPVKSPLFLALPCRGPRAGVSCPTWFTGERWTRPTSSRTNGFWMSRSTKSGVPWTPFGSLKPTQGHQNYQKNQGELFAMSLRTKSSLHVKDVVGYMGCKRSIDASRCEAWCRSHMWYVLYAHPNPQGDRDPGVALRGKNVSM